MKNSILTTVICLISLLSFGQKEYASFRVGDKNVNVNINQEIVASLPAGKRVILTATEGTGISLSIMVEKDAVKVYTLTGELDALITASVSLSPSEVYHLKSGKIEITQVKGKTYTGWFEGKAAKGSDTELVPVSAKFQITLDF